MSLHTAEQSSCAGIVAGAEAGGAAEKREDAPGRDGVGTQQRGGRGAAAVGRGGGGAAAAPAGGGVGAVDAAAAGA